MRVSINAADNIVVIDGEPCRSDCAELITSGISIVQWYGDHGEIEFIGHAQPNGAITDFAPYQSYVDNAVPLNPSPSTINPQLNGMQLKTAAEILIRG